MRDMYPTDLDNTGGNSVLGMRVSGCITAPQVVNGAAEVLLQLDFRPPLIRV